jgi:hypothetical protein
VRPLLQWKSSEYYTTRVCVCICSLRYSACNAPAPYCHPWPAPLYIFPHFLINVTILEKIKLLDIKCVFRVSLQLFSETFFILRITERDKSKMYICLHRNHPLFVVTFQGNLNFLDRYSKSAEISNFNENQFVGSRVLTCGLTDGRTDRRT